MKFFVQLPWKKGRQRGSSAWTQPSLREKDTLKSPRSLYMQNCREILEIDVDNSYFKMEQLSAWGTPPGGHVSTGLGFCPEVDWCIQDSNNLLNVLDGYFRSWKLLGK